MYKLLNDKFIPLERRFFNGCFWVFFTRFSTHFRSILSAVLQSYKLYFKPHLRSWRVLVLIQVIVFLVNG